ncbi:TetR/AcrR family transcriptional regulator C-terminal domain-containing protein [Arthrobacter sp. Sa2CUA1]|uniref:TetR/AcrR family transcriptional regulator C-terminal domain-containing protein n=1 Tax=Arthrobacter gallicola TaxID=2762225 RepID=A0ABR8UVG1_9MICC|nr:TetR/AcrR family transcriptional regulator C-terminal domain-containing protein [Arthrobacter gallicola]MBD7996375.1 TetR/AcrR family transcriptional regulator C-terminal domain-containing protein [Arthrobacter gallicola]
MKKPAVSRRERPAKPALSRQWIIDTTIEIMRTEGLEKATMRRVAQALDTGPASLYVYVANTAELHAAVLEELTGSVPAAEEGDWMTRLDALLGSYADILFTYPGLARSALVLRPVGPHSLALFDRVLGLLLDGGIEPERAAWGVDLLLQYVTATAAEHSPAAPSNAAASEYADAEKFAAAVRGASKTPRLAAHMDAVLSGTPDQRFRWALRALAAGIAATPVPGTGA